MDRIIVTTTTETHTFSNSNQFTATVPSSGEIAYDPGTGAPLQPIEDIHAELDTSTYFELIAVPATGGGAPTVESIQVESSDGSVSSPGGCSWTYSGTTLVFVFSRPSSGHYYSWLFDESGSAPPIKMTVKVSRP